MPNISFRNLNETQLYKLAGVIASIAVILLIIILLQSKNVTEYITQPEEAPIVEEDECNYRRFVDGVCVTHSSLQAPDLVAVMVENHFEARPQSGLAEALVAYEVPVEGNIPRFMLIYDKEETVEKVGPVRSARPYYLDWLQEFGNVPYMHVGGSPKALELITQHNIFDVNEFYRGWYFWRSKDRYAPHNTYTSSELWQKMWKDYGDDGDIMSTSSWQYSSEELCEENCVDEITITYSGLTYQTQWRYNTSTAQYVRYQSGGKYKDSDGSEVLADTIILQHVKTQVLDNVGRLAMNSIGEGEAIVFRDGMMTTGTWKKETTKEKTRWYDTDGEELSLKAGKIWIQVANQQTVVDF